MLALRERDATLAARRRAQLEGARRRPRRPFSPVLRPTPHHGLTAALRPSCRQERASPRRRRGSSASKRSPPAVPVARRVRATPPGCSSPPRRPRRATPRPASPGWSPPASCPTPPPPSARRASASAARRAPPAPPPIATDHARPRGAPACGRRRVRESRCRTARIQNPDERTRVHRHGRLLALTRACHVYLSFLSAERTGVQIKSLVEPAHTQFDRTRHGTIRRTSARRALWRRRVPA